MLISWKYPTSTDPPTKDAFDYKLQLHSQLFVGFSRHLSGADPGICERGRKPLSSIPPSFPFLSFPLPFPSFPPALRSPLEVGPP